MSILLPSIILKVMTESNSNQKLPSIFFIEVDKIKPNPLQPRQEFDEAKLAELADSIKQYGVLQPLVVVRTEKFTPSGIVNEYELIAGERRLRASKLAGFAEVPVLIRDEPAEKVKLEMAIVENVQREDLNALDRGIAFSRLQKEFGLSHKEIGARLGKSREYVANLVRILQLPQEMQQALKGGRISEGHTRPLLMLSSRPEEQKALFEDILHKNINVRSAELISRKIAVERAHKKEPFDPEIRTLESKLREALGTRISIEQRGAGGRVYIDFFSPEDLKKFLARVAAEVEGETREQTVSQPIAAGKVPPSPLPEIPPELVADPLPLSPALSEEEIQTFTI